MLTLASCDTVSENDRYIYVEEAEVQRCVLLEDFTGQRCLNCPNAAVEINKLQESYPNSIIAVAIHSGRLSTTTLKSHVGEEYYDAAGKPAQPAGRINRCGEPSVPGQWQNLVHNAVQQKTTVTIEIANTYNAATNKTDINVNLHGLLEINGKLQIWLVEDDIKARQLMPNNQWNDEYIHNHVLRAAVNGTWGENITLEKGTSKAFAYTADLDPKAWIADTEQTWNPANMYVVAFVYDGDGVQNVAKAPIIANAGNNENE